MMNHLLKLLGGGCLAAMLCAPTVCKAESTTIYERGTTTPWSDADISAGWSTPTSGTLSVDGGLTYTSVAGKGNSTSTLPLKVTANSKITVKAVWNVGSATGYNAQKSKSKQTYSIFSIGDLKFRFYGSDWYSTVQVGDDEAVKLSGLSDRNAVWTIDATIDQATGAITYSVATSTNKTASGTLTHPNGTYSSLIFGQGGNSASWPNTTVLTSVDVSEEQQSVTKADYTVKYVCDGAELKTASNYQGVVGQKVTLSASDKNAITTEDGTRYIYTSDDAASTKIASNGTSVVTVNFHKARTAKLNVTYNVNGTTSTTTTALAETDEGSTAWSYAYPLYMKGADGVYYKADNTESFGESGTFTDGETIDHTVTYSTADNQIVFYSEAEDAAGTDFTHSNGATGAVKAQNKTNRGLALGTYPSGTYEVTVAVTARADRQLAVRDASSEDATANQLAITDGKSLGEQTLTVVLPEEKTLVLNGRNADNKSNQSADFDYVIVRKTGEATTTVNVNTTSLLASYSSAYTVTVPEDVTIYKATAANTTTVTLQKVDTKVVPAGQGVILYSETGGDKTLSYGGTAGESLFSDNLLKATGAAAVTATGSEYTLVKGQTAFAKVAADVAIPAGKAYLNVENASAKMIVDFGSATGIYRLQPSTNTADAPRYNLAGQRVYGSARGIVIVNGKKYVK